MGDQASFPRRPRNLWRRRGDLRGTCKLTVSTYGIVSLIVNVSLTCKTVSELSIYVIDSNHPARTISHPVDTAKVATNPRRTPPIFTDPIVLMVSRIYPRFDWFPSTILVVALSVPLAQGQVPNGPISRLPTPVVSTDRLAVEGGWHLDVHDDTVNNPSAPEFSRLFFPSGSLPSVGVQPVSYVPHPHTPWRAEQHYGVVAGSASDIPQFDEASAAGRAECADSWQWLPEGILYQAYIAGAKEPRFASAWFEDDVLGTIWETGMGGRLGIVRRGSCGSIRPEGWQVDMQGGVLPRLTASQQDLISVDYRIGILNTWRQGPFAVKVGYDHLSSHLGDEFLLANPGLVRINYARDAFVLGAAFDAHQNIRVYGEIGVAASVAGGAEPVEFQYGVEYSPTCPGVAPFLAVNAHLRQEFNFGGSFNILGGWQCRSAHSDHVFRVGGQYYKGKSLQHSFFGKNEELAGLGMWIDF